MTAPPVAARFVGASVKRREDPRMLTGHGSYVDDVRVPGMLHAAFVRSPHARAAITRVDVSQALALDGVRAVYTGADLRLDNPQQLLPSMFDRSTPMAPMQALARDDVRFVGDPVALVVAESRYVAEDACELVEIDYEPTAAVVDFEQAADAEILVHPELGSNVASTMATPDDPVLQEIFDTAAHVVTETFYQHRQTNVPMETRGVVASWEPSREELRVWISTQSPHEVRLACARLLDVPEHAIRVTMGDVGGGFGQKFFVGRDEACVVMAAHRLGRPVKWIEDRAENLIASNHARTDRVTVKMAVDESGTILGAHVAHLDDSGAFPSGGTGGGGALVGALFSGPYRVPRVGFSTTSVWTNTCGRGAYRGPWMMETVARESMMDRVARAIGMDPLEFRRRNVIQRDELPFSTATGMVFENVSPAETLEQAASILDYEAFRKEQEAARAGGRYLGVGISLYIEPSAMGFGPLGVEVATVRVEPTGAVNVLLGTGSHGQSIETTMAQVVADHLGVDVDDVRVIQGDTASAPFGGGTGGSRTAVIAGGAAREASLDVRAKVLELAAHLLEAAPDDLEVAGGAVSVRGTPARAVTFAEIGRLAYIDVNALPPGAAPGIEATARFKAPPVTHSNACHVCTCEVDTATGKVTLLRYIVSEDCGVMINPMVVEGQIAGGVVQGIGGVLYEHVVYDEHGNPLTTTFLDYLVPTAAEVPMIEYGHVETPSSTPGGHKGMGEGGAIGAPPAVFNAVADALAPLGVVVTRQPLGPSEVLRLLEEAAPGR